jgi:hypothetical protein
MLPARITFTFKKESATARRLASPFTAFYAFANIICDQKPQLE